MNLLHGPLMGGLLHLVSQCTNHRIAV